MTLVRGILSLCLCAVLAIGSAGAAPPSKGKKLGDDDGGAADVRGVVFTPSEHAIITSYFARGGVPAGKPLPPGIAKKVARGGTLPPGIAKRYFPRDLDERLPSPPIGMERVIVGSDVLLVQISTGAIFDIIRQALR